MLRSMSKQKRTSVWWRQEVCRLWTSGQLQAARLRSIHLRLQLRLRLRRLRLRLRLRRLRLPLRYVAPLGEAAAIAIN